MFRMTMLILISAQLIAAPTSVRAAGSRVAEVVEFSARPFELSQVRLLDGPFRDAMELDRRYLRSLDSDRLLHMFRINAGLPSSAEPLGGWERPDCELRGHTIGHYLSACALMYASTGDEQLLAKAESIVTELGKCQRALGESGYLSAFPESWFDRVEESKPVWAPYYTLHKIYAGLLDMHRLCDSAAALEIADKMADWNRGRLGRLSDEHMQRMLNTTEQGGMNDAFAGLYCLTGNPQHMVMSKRFNQNHYNEPLLRAEDRLKGEHVNSFIPNIIGTARQFELTADPDYRKIVEFFWEQVAEHRSYCTGGTSLDERWQSDPDRLADQLGDHTQETCCTYNMLKLTRHLFTWKPDVRYADFYERALYNSILSTQNPRTGMMMYFVPLSSGRWKTYNLPDNSFWCCTGTGMENHAKYGDSIYFHCRSTLYVNLFIASELDWSQQGVRIRQDTSFPEEESTSLTIRTVRPIKLDIRIRVPYWATAGVAVKLNGEPIEAKAEPATYLAIDRTWKDGDRIDVHMPMTLHMHPMPDDGTLVAFMYGPLVLAGQLSGEGLTDEFTHTPENWYRFPEQAPEVAPLLVESKEISACIEPIPGERLAFRTVGSSEPMTLVPYHRLFDRRYIIYWRIYRKDSAEHRAWLKAEQQRKEFLARVVDRIEIGDPISERDHDLDGRNTQAGTYAGRSWRHASDGGWFSYKLKVLPDKPVTLRCTFWGSDTGQRQFDVLVDGRMIDEMTLNDNAPGTFFDRDYRLNRELTADRERVTVTLRARPGNTAGGLFGCAMLKD